MAETPEPGTVPEAAENAAAEPPPETDANEVVLDSDHSDTAKPKGRDAKNRIELRETKARLEKMQRAEAERIAAGTLADPTDLWLAGVAVNDILDEHGDLDAEKITATIDALIEKHPHWRAPQPETPKMRRGLTSGATTTTTRSARSWADAIRQRRD